MTEIAPVPTNETAPEPAPELPRERKHIPIRYTYMFWYQPVPAPRRMDSSHAMLQHIRRPFACICSYQPTPTDPIHVGISRCSPMDQFVYTIARSAALGRAMKAAQGKRASWTVSLPADSGEGLKEQLRGLREQQQKPSFINQLPDYLDQLDLLESFAEELGISFTSYNLS